MTPEAGHAAPTRVPLLVAASGGLAAIDKALSLSETVRRLAPFDPHRLRRALLTVALAAACAQTDPDPVIRDGVDVGPIQSFEGERIQNAPGLGAVTDASASDTHALMFYSSVTASAPIELLTEISGVVVRARGEECQGWPEMEVTLDGVQRLLTQVKSRSFVDYAIVAHLMPGMHQVDLRFTNDFYQPPCDRNLVVDKVTFVNARSVNKGDLRGTQLLLPAGIKVVDDPLAQGGKAVAFMSEATAIGQTELAAAAAGFSVRARGDQCQGGPELRVSVDGVERAAVIVSATAWTDYPVAVPLEPGIHSVAVGFDNDRYDGPGCDRNLYLDTVRVLAAMPPVGVAGSTVAGSTVAGSTVAGGADAG